MLKNKISYSTEKQQITAHTQKLDRSQEKN